MEQWYDKEEDILNIELNDEEYWKSIEISENIVLDLSKSGKIIGIEIHNASNIFSGDKKNVLEKTKLMVK